MRRPSECPKCQGSMSEGVTVDVAYGQSLVSQWQAAPNKVSRWFGLKVRRKDWIPTVTYRCARCGFLESYAPPIR